MNFEYMKAKAEQDGNHWFDRDAMRFFNTVLSPSSIVKMDEGVYRFISSERTDMHPRRRYTVREFSILANDQVRVTTIGEFQQYATLNEAYKSIRA